MVVAAVEEGKGGSAGTKGEGNREKGEASQNELGVCFEVHAKRRLRGCFSDFSEKSAMTDYEFALKNIAEILEKLASEEGKR